MCKICLHDRVAEINQLIAVGVPPAEIIRTLGVDGMNAGNIARHRLRHVQGIRPRHWVKGRCLVCADAQCDEADRLLRAGLRPSEVVAALSTSYPAKCVGIHRRVCLGMPSPRAQLIRTCREINTALGYGVRVRARKGHVTRTRLVGLTPEEKRLRHNEMVKAKARALRLRVIDEYGGACACCGEAREAFLCLDHVDGDGAAHRRDIAGLWSRGSGSRTYRWLKANGFPKDGFRVLCHNCNCARGMRGVCPHETEKARDEMGAA